MMIERPWTLAELDPGEKLDRRVRRRIRTLATARAPLRRAAPFLPLERAVYALVVAVYALYAGARTVQVLQDAHAAEMRRGVYRFTDPRRADTETDAGRSSDRSSPFWRGRAPRRG